MPGDSSSALATSSDAPGYCLSPLASAPHTWEPQSSPRSPHRRQASPEDDKIAAKNIT